MLPFARRASYNRLSDEPEPHKKTEIFTSRFVSDYTLFNRSFSLDYASLVVPIFYLWLALEISAKPCILEMRMHIDVIWRLALLHDLKILTEWLT